MNLLPDQDISLALSGGGTRAMAYHLGVLKWMAERDLFGRVTRISTVSGGSLLMGFIYRSNDFKWPSSEHFLKVSLPEISELLCRRSLQAEALSQLFWPPNWRFGLSRANLVAIELRQYWGFDVPLSRIQKGPEWSINGTNAQNGKRFRFKGEELGDYSVGYTVAPDFPLSQALAVSAAFPVGIGPLTIRTDKFIWLFRPFGKPKSAEKVVKLEFEKLHLYDGGLYDNLGSESFFDLGKQESKNPGDFIVVSDAGAPLTYGMTWGPLSWQRVKRMMDILSDQTRSLRVRALVNFLIPVPSRGAFIPIDTKVAGPDCPEAAFARTFPTSLSRFDVTDFNRLMVHGYAAAGAASDFGFLRLPRKPVTPPAAVPAGAAGLSPLAPSASPGVASPTKSLPTEESIRTGEDDSCGLPVTEVRHQADALSGGATPQPERATTPLDQLLARKKPQPILFFEAFDIALTRMMSGRVATAIRRWWEKWGEDLLSPTVGGMGIGAIFWLIDGITSPLPGCSKFQEWSESATKEINPQLFVLSVVLLGISFVLAGSPLARGIRNLFLLPVTRLGQDATMFGLGVLTVLGTREAVQQGLSAGTWISWAQASYILACIGVMMFLIKNVANVFATQSAQYISGRLFVVVLGAVLLYISTPVLLEPIKPKKEDSEKQARCALPRKAEQVQVDRKAPAAKP